METPDTEARRYEIFQDYAQDPGRGLANALRWSQEAPEEVWSWLMLAEVFLMNKEMDSCLEALEQAQAVEGSHPMFHRLACIAALEAKAFTSAHGSLVASRFSGLSQMIWLDLEEKVSNYCIDLETGLFPEDENPDIRWQQLVPFSAWRIADPPRQFVWEKIGDVFIIHDKAMLDASLEARGKTGKDFLTVAEQVRRWMPPFIYNALEEHCDQPSNWMLQSWTVDRIQALLHLSGHFPRPSQSGDQLIQLEQGEVEIILIPGLQDPTDSRAYAIASSEVALKELGTIFKKIRPGWLNLSGPVAEIQTIYY